MIGDIHKYEKSRYLYNLLRFLIINFYNFCYIFTLYHFFVISCYSDLRLICLAMGAIFLFFSGIVIFVYDGDWSEIVVASVAELWVTIVNGFQWLTFVVWGFVWYVAAVLNPWFTSSYIFHSVYIKAFIMVCLEVSFSERLFCRETGQRICID